MDAQQQQQLDTIGGDSTLDAIVNAWARAKIQKMEILNHNGAMLAYTAKASTANNMGLTDKQKLGVTPFPAPTTTIVADPSVMQQATAKAAEQEQKLLDYLQGLQKEMDDLKQAAADKDKERSEAVQAAPAPAAPSKWKQAAQAGALLALGAAGAAGLYAGGSALRGKDDPQPAPVETRDEVVNTRGNVGLEVEGWLKP